MKPLKAVIVICVTFIGYKEARTCTEKQFQCTSGECINDIHRCDASKDCKEDWSDEIDCESCRPGRFWCDNRRCIKLSYKCDNGDDCGDLSDERNCGKNSFNVKPSFEVTNLKNSTTSLKDVSVEDPSSEYVGPSFGHTNMKNLSMPLKKGDKLELICNAIGNPNPTVTWTWGDKPLTNSSSWTFFLHGNNQLLYLENISLEIQGRLTCTAENKRGTVSEFVNVSVTDPISDYVIPKFELTNLKNSSKSLNKGDRLELICNAVGNPNPIVSWTWQDKPSTTWSSLWDVSLQNNDKILNLNVSTEMSGRFSCKAKNRVGEIYEFVDIFVRNPASEHRKPYFEWTNLKNSSKYVKSGANLDLSCGAAGNPKPKVNWSWQNEPSTDWPWVFELHNSDQLLNMLNVSANASGRYTCTAGNALGQVSEYVDVFVENPVSDEYESSSDDPKPTYLIMKVGLALSGIIVLVLGGFLLRFKYKQMKLNMIIAGISQKQFYEGDVENINPDMSVTDQANLLPFQQTTWEIPKHSLQLGSPLGSGAFGMVLKGQAIGVVEGEERTTVAVKMVKPNADESHFKALMTELKIMAHLGKHLNIVNLIGARTKNLAKNRELLVVMEYCKHGSLLSYLHRNRHSFINQLDPTTDKIDPSICSPVGSTSKTLGRNENQQNQTSSDDNQIEASNGYLLDAHNGDFQSTEIQSISSTDLLGWAFQAAKGMEYLSSRKVLHGDLAARNVLLADNFIVKICDFGYARETFKSYDYKKNTKGVLLPIKWMAIESIYCGIFSSKSDCWSFGVLLWEMFTLGNKPYPGMEVDEEFCQKINDGYRMTKPQNAPNSVYQVMLDCWAHEPTDRPLFSQVADRLGELISNWVRNHILDLTERVNQQGNNINEQTDLLSQMGNAEFHAEGGEAEADLGGDRYKQVPTPMSEMEPVCSITVQNGSRQSRFFKQRPTPPQRKIF